MLDCILLYSSRSALGAPSILSYPSQTHGMYGFYSRPRPRDLLLGLRGTRAAISHDVSKVESFLPPKMMKVRFIARGVNELQSMLWIARPL